MLCHLLFMMFTETTTTYYRYIYEIYKTISERSYSDTTETPSLVQKQSAEKIIL